WRPSPPRLRRPHSRSPLSLGPMARQWLSLEGELPLLGARLLGLPTMERLAELADQVLQPGVAFGERRDLPFQSVARSTLRLDDGPGLWWQRSEVEIGGRRHGASIAAPRPAEGAGGQPESLGRRGAADAPREDPPPVHR